jgi:hypothetical protein
MATIQTFTAGQVLTAAQLNTLQSYVGAVQVLNTVKTDTFTVASTAYTDITGLSVSITPTSASNKVLVVAMVQGAGTASSSSGFLQLVRDSTAIGLGDTAGTRTRVTGMVARGGLTAGDMVTSTMVFLDSPATTSATTYKVQMRGQTGTTVFVNRAENDADDPSRPRGISSITVFEVTP